MELIQKTISIATLVFVLSSMLATGLGLTVSEIITPLRNARLVVLSLLANFVLMPLAAVGLAAIVAARPTARRGSAAPGYGSRRTVPAETGPDRQGQPGLRGGLDGAIDGRHGRLSAARPAAIAAGRFGQPGADCPVIVSAHVASAGWCAGCKSPVRACRRAHKTRARSGLQPEPHSADRADHRDEHQQRARRVRHARHPRRSPLPCQWVLA